MPKAKNPPRDSFDRDETSPMHLQRLWRRARRSGRTLTLMLVLAGATGAIVFNAVVLQPARHPAPLFAMVDAARAVSEKPAAPKPAPPRREQTAEKQAEATAKPERVTERPVVKPEPATEKTERTAEKTEKPVVKNAQIATVPPPPRPPARSQADPLGELIRGGIVPPASIPAEADARLLNIQKNLARLGYHAGKPDGLMGPGTRAAIEKFERSRKWTVTGEVTPQLMRELGTVSAKRD